MNGRIRYGLRTWLLPGVLMVGLLAASTALADARVLVQVRSASGGNVDGTVVLTSTADRKTFSCRTAGGRCVITGVPGGRYVARFQPAKGQPAAPRKVMIPPSGEVKLTVAAK